MDLYKSELERHVQTVHAAIKIYCDKVMEGYYAGDPTTVQFCLKEIADLALHLHREIGITAETVRKELDALLNDIEQKHGFGSRPQ